jgi:hypothetical protein
VPGRRDWLGTVVGEGDALRFFGSSPEGIWSARSADGSEWQPDAGIRARGGDPGVIATHDGRTLMIVTGPPRADAASAPFLDQARPFAVRFAAPPPGQPAPGGRFPPVPLGPVPDMMTANDRYVYVLRGDVLYQFDARDLKLLRQVRLPERPGPERPPR